MFDKKKQIVRAKKQQAIDVLLSKLNYLPPSVDLVIALASGGFAAYGIYVSNQPFIGVIGAIAALCFAFLAINATLREIRWLKYLTANASKEALAQMDRPHFELYLNILFRLSGYNIRSALNELHRQDDADWIVSKKKETILVQFNHYDEEFVGIQQLQSLQKAAMVFEASGAIAITVGEFYPDAKQWGGRKGLKLMTADDLQAMAAECTGETAVAERHDTTDTEFREPVFHEHRQASCLVFVDFAALANCVKDISKVIAQFPYAQLVATTSPEEASPEMLLLESGLSIAGTTEQHPSGRYFSIQRYLDKQPQGKQTPWVALDSEPRQYPSGCSELVAINPSFGFNESAHGRLIEALSLSMRRGQS